MPNNSNQADAANNKFTIICEYCKKKTVAFNKSRTHCRSIVCRTKEIQKQLENLAYFIELFCINKIEATIELRFPGNDKMSQDAKVDSINILNHGLKETELDNKTGIGCKELIDYFSPVLWKGIKGNFIIRTMVDGTIDPKILSQTFPTIIDPTIIGNNLIVTGRRN